MNALMDRSAVPALKVEVARPGELGPEDLARWRDMQRTQPRLASPFLSPEFAVAVDQVREDARVAVLTSGPEVVGYFPFEAAGRGAGRALASWVSLAQGVVHAPGIELRADELLRGCGLHTWEFGCLVAGQPWFRPYETLVQESAVMDVGDGYLDELERRSPKFLKSTRYKERKLGRDRGEVTFELAVGSAEQLGVLRRWKSDQYARSGRADRFSRTWVAELVERLHAADGPGFGGLLSMLYADGRPVAGHFGLRAGSVLVGWFPAYDPEFWRYSPGLIQHLRMAEEAPTLGISTIDLSVDTGYEYKHALRSRTEPVAEGVARRRTAGAAARWLLTEPVRRLRRLALDTPVVYRAADRLLRWYGRARS